MGRIFQFSAKKTFSHCKNNIKREEKIHARNEKIFEKCMGNSQEEHDLAIAKAKKLLKQEYEIDKDKYQHPSNTYYPKIYKNIFKVLLVSKSEVSKIISNVKISAVTFTGSENAGSQVAMKSGKEIKKTVLELGGSDSFIVLEDANIDIASKIAIKSRFFNSGQSCIAAKRFLVHKDIYDVFIEKI